MGRDPIKKIKKSIYLADFGKKVGGDLYIYTTHYLFLPGPLRVLVSDAAAIFMNDYLSWNEGGLDFEVTKIDRRGIVSFLSYPSFFQEAHPALVCSVRCPVGGNIKIINYGPENPWILHRKELLFSEENLGANELDLHEMCVELTKKEEEAGLLKNPPGQKKAWDQHLADNGFYIRGHQLMRVGFLA